MCASHIYLQWSFQVSVYWPMTNSSGRYIFHNCKTLLCVSFITKEAYIGCNSQEKLGNPWPRQHKGDSCMLSCAFWGLWFTILFFSDKTERRKSAKFEKLASGWNTPRYNEQLSQAGVLTGTGLLRHWTICLKLSTRNEWWVIIFPTYIDLLVVFSEIFQNQVCILFAFIYLFIYSIV